MYLQVYRILLGKESALNKPLIFCDLDGTLIDTKELHAQAFILACNEHGINMTESDHATLCGLPTSQKIKRLSLPPELGNSIAEMKRKATVDALRHWRPSSVELELASKLRAIPNTIVIVSNASRYFVDLVQEKLSLPFKSYSNEDIVPKPSHLAFTGIMTGLGMSPKECIAIEDSPHGIKAAVDAGIEEVVVVDGPANFLHCGLKTLEEMICRLST